MQKQKVKANAKARSSGEKICTTIFLLYIKLKGKNTFRIIAVGWLHILIKHKLDMCPRYSPVVVSKIIPFCASSFFLSIRIWWQMLSILIVSDMVMWKIPAWIDVPFVNRVTYLIVAIASHLSGTNTIPCARSMVG